MKKDYLDICLRDEKDLRKRMTRLKNKFYNIYKTEPDIIVRAPGRAEIIGNHTDYNLGFTLSACISRSMLILFKKREDGEIRACSVSFWTKDPVKIEISSLNKSRVNNWINYLKGVISELKKAHKEVGGADLLIDSTIPIGAGVSSSAAIEVATALGLLTLYKQKIDPLSMALLSQRAENLFVGSPCGFLDQGTIVFGRAKKIVFMDYAPKANSPVSRINLIPAEINRKRASLIVVVDRNSKRNLGTSGYPARRKMCEASLAFWSKKLKKRVKSLRQISITDFEKHKEALEKHNPVMRKRVEHIIYENQRVLDAARLLKKNDLVEFGKLMVEAGESALNLYELDEKTPELTFTFNEGKKIDGVLGIRNMGGGFSATVLALVRNDKINYFQRKLGALYKNKFKRNLEFIRFAVSEGAGILQE